MRIEVENNVINKEVLERNKKYLIPNWKNHLARIYITFFLILSIICLIQGTFEMRIYAFAAFTVAAVFFFARIYVTKRNINIILSSDKTSQIKYEDINRIIDTPKDFVFISKHDSFIICQKGNLKSDEKEKIYEIIKSMNIKLVKGK